MDFLSQWWVMGVMFAFLVGLIVLMMFLRNRQSEDDE